MDMETPCSIGQGSPFPLQSPCKMIQRYIRAVSDYLYPQAGGGSSKTLQVAVLLLVGQGLA